MRKLMVATLLAGASVATPALAQDVGPTFTGPRVEAILGYDHVGAGSERRADCRTTGTLAADEHRGHDFDFEAALHTGSDQRRGIGTATGQAGGDGNRLVYRDVN